EAERVSALLGDTAWPHDAEDDMVRELGENLFNLTHRAGERSGPFPETARCMRKLIDLIAPEERPDPDDESAVLTPAEAGEYLGLRKLGVASPAAGVRHLVKTRALRSVNVLGRMAFVRSDLDEYVTRLSTSRKGSRR
ncbi:MAG: hypothetical protein AAGI37_21145, partial [Planctomycetota bacterium]